MSNLIDKARFEIKLGNFATGPATALSDPSILPLVQDYRRRVSGQMIPLDKPSIRERVPTADYHVSRKVDGEFTVFVYRDGEVFTLNPGGTVRMGMPWQEEARKQLHAAGVKQAVVVGELYVENKERRPRVHDVVAVARQPQSLADLERLRFAVFDIISLDGAPASEHFLENWATIQKLFADGTLVHPVEHRFVKSIAEIEQLFEEWVEKEDAEGLVLRSDDAGMFKIKPRYSLDVVIVGFTESTDDRQGMMHDLLLAVVRADGTLHVVSRVGGGFSEELRRSMLSDLKDMAVESEYAEVNSDHVAYQMVRPEWVAEVSCLDIISQNTRGGTVNRMVLDYQKADDAGYKVVRRLPLCTLISPQFVRLRDDKKVTPSDVSISQISRLVEVPQVDVDAREFAVPRTSVLRREIFTKQLKGETMVRKFLLLKTNKEAVSEEYPAYVVHFTDFSPNRKDALSREVLVSNSADQIEQLYQGLKDENVKKGWTAHSGVIAAPATPEASATVAASAAAVAEEQSVAPKRGKKAATKKGDVKVEEVADSQTSENLVTETPIVEKPAKAAKAKVAKEEITKEKVVKEKVVKEKAVKTKPMSEPVAESADNTAAVDAVDTTAAAKPKRASRKK